MNKRDLIDALSGRLGDKKSATEALNAVLETIQSAVADGDKVAINYLMRQNGNEWRVADIYLQGTISQIANLRSQFSAVVLRGGAPALVETLNNKTASLVPNLAAS